MPYRPDPHPFEGGSGTPLAQGLGSRHTFQPAGGVCRYVCRVSASPSSTLSIMHVVAKDTTQFASQMTDHSPSEGLPWAHRHPEVAYSKLRL